MSRAFDGCLMGEKIRAVAAKRRSTGNIYTPSLLRKRTISARVHMPRTIQIKPRMATNISFSIGGRSGRKEKSRPALRVKEK